MDEVRIKGMRELYEALSTKIPRHMEAKLLQSALAAGTSDIVRAARANIIGGGGKAQTKREAKFVGPTNKPQSRTGTLRRSIYAKRGRKSNPMMEVRIVSVYRGKRSAKKGKDAWYARLVEYGSRYAAPRPFMRPAWEAKQRPAVDKVLVKLRSGITKAVSSARWN